MGVRLGVGMGVEAGLGVGVGVRVGLGVGVGVRVMQGWGWGVTWVVEEPVERSGTAQSTRPDLRRSLAASATVTYRGTSLIRNVGPYRRTMPRLLRRS